MTKKVMMITGANKGMDARFAMTKYGHIDTLINNAGCGANRCVL